MMDKNTRESLTRRIMGYGSEKYEEGRAAGRGATRQRQAHQDAAEAELVKILAYLDTLIAKEG